MGPMGKRRKRLSQPGPSHEPQPTEGLGNAPEPAAEEPPEGVTFFTGENPPDGDLHWYWTQRHRYFSRYEEGIWMTRDSWFEVTAEAVAAAITKHMFPPTPTPRTTSVVIDAFCGIGGNAISFALSPQVTKVIAIDLNPVAIACARHNARVYGVSEKISFICGDFFSLVPQLQESPVPFAAVFLSPPWGGPGYRDDKVFDLNGMKPYNLGHIVEYARRVSKNLAVYLPRTSDLNQLQAVMEDGEEEIEVVHYCLAGKSKALTAYYGNLSNSVKAHRENGWNPPAADVETMDY